MTRYLLAFTLCCIVVLSQQSLQRNPDSLHFIKAAEDHAAGLPMRYLEDDPYDERMYPDNGYFVLFAPGYPWLLARAFDTGLSWQNAGRILNAISLGILACCILWFIRDTSAWLQAMALFLLLLNSAAIASYSHLLSDMVFTCLTFVSIVTLNMSLSQHSLPDLQP